jgi:hypothetical protein
VQPLLKRWQAGGLEITAFGLPAVQAVIEHKWRVFARRLLLWQLAIFCLWLLSFFTFAILFQVGLPVGSGGGAVRFMCLSLGWQRLGIGMKST